MAVERRGAAVDIVGLGKEFVSGQGRVVALDDINLHVAPGEFVCIVGPSGCGKSTLLRVNGDLIAPTKGTVEVNGKPAHQARGDRDYGMVFQAPVLFDWRTVEDNVKLQIAQPWMSFGSDEGSSAPEGVFLKSSTHPRAYGNFARFLGKYVRESKLVPLPDAIRRLTYLPASNLKLRRRGLLRPGYYADVVCFDAGRIADHATFEKPHQYATGMQYVWVNGALVLKEGQHTGALPGRVVRGPGYRPK